jgi:Ca-activated chloride channel homolog
LKKLILLFFFAFSGNLLLAQAKTRILFILDASNSMNAKWDHETRFQAAKSLLIKAVDSLSGNTNLEIALRVYGHQSPITATYQDCEDTKLEVPFAVNNYNNVKNRIKTLEAKGTTPIARSLEAAAGDFPDLKANNVIILITDGLEACDNDPCVIAKKLKDKGVTVTPFVIGLGMDLSYLEKFACIGTYLDAENRQAFTRVLTFAISKALVNTTTQINLNNTAKLPNETDVTIFCYKSGTKELKYTFVHTLNKKNVPDTIVMDPAFKYDILVNTIPKIEKKNVTLQYNIHNTIVIDAPQGYLLPRLIAGQKQYSIDTRVYQKGKVETLNLQHINAKDKYITGSYEVEILTLPRIYKTIEIVQSSVTYLDIVAPGFVSYKTGSAIAAQLFVINADRTIEWVCNLDEVALSANFTIQPGKYKIIYRQKKLKSTTQTVEKEFTIQSNKTTTLSL